MVVIVSRESTAPEDALAHAVSLLRARFRHRASPVRHIKVRLGQTRYTGSYTCALRAVVYGAPYPVSIQAGGACAYDAAFVAIQKLEAFVKSPPPATGALRRAA